MPQNGPSGFPVGSRRRHAGAERSSAIRLATARGINDAGQVVGWVEGLGLQPFLWTASGGVHFLDMTLPGGGGASLGHSQ